MPGCYGGAPKGFDRGARRLMLGGRGLWLEPELCTGARGLWWGVKVRVASKGYGGVRKGYGWEPELCASANGLW